jgi:hypothetical protein
MHLRSRRENTDVYDPNQISGVLWDLGECPYSALWDLGECPYSAFGKLRLDGVSVIRTQMTYVI